MLNDTATWIFNVMLLGAAVTIPLLLYDTANPGFLVGPIGMVSAIVAFGGAALIALLWPRY